MNASMLWIANPITGFVPDSATKRKILNRYIIEKLGESDWSQLPDALLTPQERDNWIAYRKALFSIYFGNTNPDDVIIPDPPAPFAAPTPAVLAARARRKAARGIAKAIPNWATWTQADWDTYFNANLNDAQADLVTSFATARVMIKRQNVVIQNLVKLVIALRDQAMPDLPD